MQKKKEEIKKVIIKKQSYMFEPRKRYFNKKRFKITEKTPLQRIMDELHKNVFLKSPGMDKPAMKNLFVPAAMIVICLVIFMLVATNLFSPALSTLNATSEVLVQPKLNITLTESGIASIGVFADNKQVAYYKLNYSVSNANAVTISTTTYANRVPNQIFLLTSKMERASTYSQFRDLLKKRLAEKNLVINEISLEQIDALPNGALLIIPSGRIPEKMVQPGNANLISLLQRGVTIIYIGQRFDEGSISETGNREPIPPNSEIRNLFSFVDMSISSNALNINSPLYRISQSKMDSEFLYGAISKQIILNSTILFVPQTLDNGWKSPDSAAHDIEKIITEMRWITPESETHVYIPVVKNTSNYAFFLSQSFIKSKKNIVVRVIASNEKNETTEKLDIIYPRKNTNGDLFYSTTYNTNLFKVISTNVTNKDIQFIIRFNETNKGKQKLFFVVTNVYGKEAQPNYSISYGTEEGIELQGTNQFSGPLNLDEGIYLASIMDGSGNSYAQAILDVIAVNFKTVSADYEQGKFNFSAYAKQDQPVNIAKLQIIVDEKYKFDYVDKSTFEVNLSKYVNPLPSGNHTFEFRFSNTKKQIVLTKTVPTPSFYENPVYWIMSLIALVLFIGTPYLAALIQKTEYSLDIPDFPPLASIKIPIKKDAVFNIFEKINEDYKWENTPLTLSEIKKGFRKIIYQNKPIFISDYNLEYILEELQNKGYVKNMLEYYGLSKWEADTKRNIIQLAIHRKIRDICINEAIPFSKLGESQDYDINLKVLGQDIFIYIMDSFEKREERLSSALKIMHKGIVVLLFENSDAKKDFEDTINAASETSGLVKLEIMAGSLTPLTINELEKMLKDMKEI
ncbi:MAG: hypothetical protein AB1391_01985 [Candidatus Micrarchaeota archaeon]